MTPEFKKLVIQKIVSLLVSLKVHIFFIATLLLVMGKITADNWTTLLISLAAARVGIQIVGRFREQVVQELDK